MLTCITKKTFTQKRLGAFLYVTYQLYVKVQVFQRIVLNWTIANSSVGLHVLVYERFAKLDNILGRAGLGPRGFFVCLGWVCACQWQLVTTLRTQWDSHILEAQLEYISKHVKAKTAHWLKQSNNALAVCFKYTSERNNLLTLTGWGIYSKSHKKSVACLGQLRFFWTGGIVLGWLM